MHSLWHWNHIYLHLASFLLAVMRKSLISSIFFGCQTKPTEKDRLLHATVNQTANLGWLATTPKQATIEHHQTKNGHIQTFYTRTTLSLTISSLSAVFFLYSFKLAPNGTWPAPMMVKIPASTKRSTRSKNGLLYILYTQLRPKLGLWTAKIHWDYL